VADGCGFRNSYTRCKAGWIYEPDGFGCVQSALCPVCDGEGKITMKNYEKHLLPGAKYKQKYEVLLHVTRSQTYTVRAVNQKHAMDIAAHQVAKRHKQTDNKGLGFVKAVSLDAKRVDQKP